MAKKEHWLVVPEQSDDAAAAQYLTLVLADRSRAVAARLGVAPLGRYRGTSTAALQRPSTAAGGRSRGC
jgi:hypothetical protein